MNNWRIWQDEYCGTDWNDRREISKPAFEGIPIDDDKVEEELLSNYVEEVRELVEIDGNEAYIQALLSICSKCDEPVAWCQCRDTGEDLSEYQTYVGYHAERIAS